jgi:hypothetical protein
VLQTFTTINSLKMQLEKYIYTADRSDLPS